MNWTLIGIPALALAGACIDRPVEALPAAPARPALTAAQSPLLLPAAYYWDGYHRYRHAVNATASSTSEVAGSGAVKPGRWEFTAQLRASATPARPEGLQLSQGTRLPGGGDATYVSCIESDKAVPAPFGPQCKLDSWERNGPRITWSMSCTNTEGAVRSEGVAQYHGDTMDATMTSHFPDANGTVRDLTQRITGRYLGPCTQMAEGTATPPSPNIPPKAPPATAANPHPDAPPKVQPGASAEWVEPPAASGNTAPSAAAAAPPSASAVASANPPEPEPPLRPRYAQHRRHYYHHRYYGYGGEAWPGGGGLLGIWIPFLGAL